MRILSRFASCLLLVFTVVATSPAHATKIYSALFIGNSFTYFPAETEGGQPNPENPQLPKIFEAIVESKIPDLDFRYEFHTPGGYSFKAHFNHEKSKALLAKEYDSVILQSHSIESLELPAWFLSKGFSDKTDFMNFGQDLMQISATPTDRIYLYSPWAYHPNHAYYKPSFEGLRFEAKSKKAGQFWYGRNWEDGTNLIYAAYDELSALTGAHVVPVGRAWLEVKNSQGAVHHDQLYYDLKTEHFHPGYKGSYLTACVLFATIFKRSPEGAAFDPARITQGEAAYLQRLAYWVAFR